MKKLKFYKPEEQQMVGTYIPSELIKNAELVAVMDSETSGLIATTGILAQNANKPNVFGFQEYANVFTCIEQAQLYANAGKMFEMLAQISAHAQLTNGGGVGRRVQLDIDLLLEQITDISEPVERLLGADALKIMEAPKIKELL